MRRRRQGCRLSRAARAHLASPRRFFDNASLFIGLYAAYMARWKPDAVYTYGYARYEVLAGFVNAIFLVFVGVRRGPGEAAAAVCASERTRLVAFPVAGAGLGHL